MSRYPEDELYGEPIGPTELHVTINHDNGGKVTAYEQTPLKPEPAMIGDGVLETPIKSDRVRMLRDDYRDDFWD